MGDLRKNNTAFRVCAVFQYLCYYEAPIYFPFLTRSSWLYVYNNYCIDLLGRKNRASALVGRVGLDNFVPA
jgi:hypothetical protein